jgi:carbonic anhydrase
MLACLLGVVLLVPSAVRAQWKTPWTYEGADHWGDLDPLYAICNTGKQQSPIDIQSTQKAPLPAIQFEYKSGPLRYLVNNGYTIRVDYHDAPGSGNFLVVGDRRYQLTQLHFHHPSEEHVHGKAFAMVVHLMHQSSDGEVVGVAVLVRAGKANSTVQQLWDHMPMTKGNEQEIPGVEVDPSGLLPARNGYYMYKGSLTAPPCTEGVTWFVLKNPLELSDQQIAAFAKLYPHDVRPLQPLNGRIVEEK